MAPTRLAIKDAATLILIDDQGNGPQVLLGKRSNKHTFMPNMYVFPGGRRDRADMHVAVNSQLMPSVIDNLLVDTPKRVSKAIASSLAITAVRELFEETNLMLTQNFKVAQPQFDLAPLKLIARAITPPKNVRRFDTRFFACMKSDFDLQSQKLIESDELTDFIWVPINNPGSIQIPEITELVLNHLSSQFDANSNLIEQPDIMFFKQINGKRNSQLAKVR